MIQLGGKFHIIFSLEFGMPMELVQLIKMCLNETYCEVNLGKYLSGTFSNKNGLQQVEALSPHLFNFAVDCHLCQANKEGLKFHGTHQLLIYAEDVNLLVKAYVLQRKTQLLY